MKKDFMQFVYNRIENVLTKNEEYRELQSKCAELDYADDEYEAVSYKLEALSQELCYMQGFKDAMKLLMMK